MPDLVTIASAALAAKPTLAALPLPMRACRHEREISGSQGRRLQPIDMKTAKHVTRLYLLLLRGTSWHKGLSPEEIQKDLART